MLADYLVLLVHGDGMEGMVKLIGTVEDAIVIHDEY